MYKIISFIIVVIFLTTSCEKNMIEAAQLGVWVESDDDLQEVITKMGAYGPAFTYTDGYQQLEMYKNGLYQITNSPMLMGYKDASLDISTYVGNFSFDDNNLSNLLNSSAEAQVDFVKTQFGQPVSFSMLEDGIEIYRHDLYVPKEIIIDQQRSAFSVSGGNVGAIKAGSPIYINEDTNNSNGLFVTLWYQGEHANMTMDDIQNSGKESNEFMRHLYIPEDTGVIELPTAFLDGIPHNGMFYLQIERSNFQVFEIEDRTHKLKGGSSYGLSIVLHR